MSEHSSGVRVTQIRRSRTWSSSSGELGLLSDTDEIDDRSIFLQEYNRLAKKVRISATSIKGSDARTDEMSIAWSKVVGR
jgi:hypothetical protein